MPGNFTHRLTSIPAGAAGTRATLSMMERLVQQGIRDPGVVLYAQNVVRNSPEYGQSAEASAILEDVRRTMRYTLDPLGVETVKDPSFILQEIQRKGRAAMDCDDASVWTSTLLRAIGIPTRFKVIKDDPREFTHVFLQAWMDDGWVNVDPIARSMGLGIAPTGRFGQAVYDGRTLRGVRGGNMAFRGMGADATTQGGTGNALLDTVLSAQKSYYDFQAQKKANKTQALPSQPAYVPAAPQPFPWGKIALVAGAGVGLIVALRLLKKRR